MPSDRWKQVETVFHAALNREKTERAAFLDAACNNDLALREEVESMLMHAGAQNPANEKPSVRPGMTLGHYEIVARLGTGGMGHVWQAKDRILGRDVAIKTLPEEFSRDPERLSRFKREAKLLAALNHPNIGVIYGLEDSRGTLFLVLELIEGPTLKEFLGGRPVPVRSALKIGVQIAEALEAAHEKGVVHRDLKPGNIMLTTAYGTETHVKLLDFGLAARTLPIGQVDSGADTTLDLTPPGTLVGTIAYLAPERFDEETLDPRSDIFSFGIVMYEMITGVHPFWAKSERGAIRAMLEATAPPLATHAAQPNDVPEFLEYVVKKMLERDTNQRYQSTREVLTDLNHLLENPDPPAPPHPDPSAIAVLPFADLSPQKDQEFLCDGVVEDLIFAMQDLNGLHVASRTSAFRFKHAEQSIREIGEQLHVNAIVEGSLRREGNRLRITVRLVDISQEADDILWSERYDREVGDIFEIQDEISRVVVRELEITLLASDSSLAQAGTDTFKTYELYLKGRFYWNERTEEGLTKSLPYFKKAIQEDPKYVRAHAGLADSYTTLGIYGVEPPEDVMPLAKLSAERAIELARAERERDSSLSQQEIDRGLALALVARGGVRSMYEWDWGTAQQDFLAAIELRGNDAHAHHWYATNCLMPTGRFDEARFHLKLAKEFDQGTNSIINTSLGLPDYFERKYDEAVDTFLEALDPNESFGMAHYFLGLAYAEKEMYDNGLEELKRAVTLNRNSPETLAALGCVCAAARERSTIREARRLLDDLVKLSAERYVSPVLIAQVQTALGQTEQAFEQLDKAYQLRATDLVWLRVRPAFDALRSDPRFEKLCAKIFPLGKASAV